MMGACAFGGSRIGSALPQRGVDYAVQRAPAFAGEVVANPTSPHTPYTASTPNIKKQSRKRTDLKG